MIWCEHLTLQNLPVISQIAHATNSSVPFVIVQNDMMHVGGYDKIMIPLDLHNETKQKLEIVADMAKYFDSEVHLPKATAREQP